MRWLSKNDSPGIDHSLQLGQAVSAQAVTSSLAPAQSAVLSPFLHQQLHSVEKLPFFFQHNCFRICSFSSGMFFLRHMSQNKYRSWSIATILDNDQRRNFSFVISLLRSFCQTCTSERGFAPRRRKRLNIRTILTILRFLGNCWCYIQPALLARHPSIFHFQFRSRKYAIVNASRRRRKMSMSRSRPNLTMSDTVYPRN